MKTPDKLFNKIKKTAQKQELQSFDQKEKVWSAVLEQLEHKKRKKMIFYKTLGAAAVIAVLLGVGFSWFNSTNVSSKTNVVSAPINKDIKNENDNKTSIATEEDSSIQKELNQLDAEIKIQKKTNPKIANSTKIAAESEKNNIAYEDSSPQSSSKNSMQLALEAQSDDLEIQEAASSPTLQAKDEIATKTITGKVTDQYTNPLSGVLVFVKNTPQHTQTDVDGNYSIAVEPKQTLVFSYLGFKTKEIKVENQKNLEVVLEEEIAELNEVVMDSNQKMNYDAKIQANVKQELKKAEALQLAYVQAPPPPPPAPEAIEVIQDDQDVQETIVESSESILYDVNVVEKDEIVVSAYGGKINDSKTLQGLVAGINVNNGNKQAKSAVTIIRGKSSLSGNSTPLYIINGQPANEDEFRSLNPNHIQAVKLVKDADAVKNFGNRGANGAIIVLTKDANQKEKMEFDSISNHIATPSSNEEYESYKENPFTSPLAEPLSTFSIDVDRAAYTNIRRMINNGQEVPKDAVRIEEMLNFFEYDYPKPNSKHPFTIHTTYSDAPWNTNHKLLKIALQGKDLPLEELPASNLVFLIDVSGSMNSQNKLPLVKKSLKLLTDQMRDTDKIALVTYAGNSQILLNPTSGKEKAKIKNAIDQLATGGGTNASQGIETAYQLAEENLIKNGNNRVIIATDGDFNIGVTSNSSLEELISKKKASHIYLTCLGYGIGNYKGSKMQSLSQKGNGNYAYIDTHQEAQKFLEREFKGSMYAIAKDVKIQIEFNPKHVQSYRLIGYETRMLEAKDFKNDQKDAGEIGVNHQVTALYEIVPRGVESPFGEFKPDLKYQQVKTPSFENHSDELATVKFRYKPPQENKSIKIERVIKNKAVQLKNTDPDFKFATAVAWFGLYLRESKLITKSNKEDILLLAKQGLQNDKEGYRAEFIRLVNLYE